MEKPRRREGGRGGMSGKKKIEKKRGMGEVSGKWGGKWH